jgi:hypothetical protein
LQTRIAAMETANACSRLMLINCLRLFELSRVFVRFDHVASGIVNANRRAT